ncbi:alpha-amylase family glycosyl hydrolase [Paenibacillus thermotolerans]|uniref:alpha-amylase family glycosyl hydrolase n=1 Tax=Paenibacillus thermotolerans TaxID=3027807 RepID=UPI0023675F45|nr:MULTISPECIES: alpha-amylase family glycosyl hydrolase [unclassified Paenibacillus]
MPATLARMDKQTIRYFHDGTECVFDRTTGRLLRIANDYMTLPVGELLIDVGIDGHFVLGRLRYHSLDPLHTWETPPIVPLIGQENAWEFTGYNDRLDALQMFYKVSDLEVSVRYAVISGTLEITASITNLRNEKRLINGVGFLLQLQSNGETSFDFPGNVPHPVFRSSELQSFQPVVAGLVNPVIHSECADGHLNVLFLDEEEKWGTGVYADEAGGLCYVNLAGVESYLDVNESFFCGTLYVQPLGRRDRFEPIRDLYRRKGWNPPANGHTEGVLYSCHPFGTMDSGFPTARTMREFAEDLPALKRMGIDHVWVLPIFEHLSRGVYHPTDQRIIDSRYGTDEDVAFFSRKLHDLGMTLLFDYVPHGPELDDPIGIEYRRWAAVDRDGKPKIEWNCLSFDMTNPEYREYTKGLVMEHVDRFDIDGSRIDCAMGGLSNWNPVTGNRPSSSSVRGGVSISKAIRDGIVAKGKKPIVTPENFNPLPFYAPYTDIFYDFPLYRVLFELENADVTEAEYVFRLTRWLHAEMMSAPERYLKLRFLGNHDTVTWVWQKARATAVYGMEKAKALWVLMSCIDGIPMIYQGDEDASIYNGNGPDLRSFFTELFQARKTWLGNEYNVTYLFTGTPIMAFTREHLGNRRLIVVNLSSQNRECALDYAWDETVFGQPQPESGKIRLDKYGYSILKLL